MPETPTSGQEITQALRALRAGDQEASADLYRLVYAELRKIARAQIRRHPGATLVTTELIHEAFLRLGVDEGNNLENRAHFFALSARAMRQVLIDHFRHRKALKRGAGERPIEFQEGKIAVSDRGEMVLALDEALEGLEALSPRLASVVELKFFGGMTETEIGAVVGRTARTVRSDWRKAKSWLARELNAGTQAEKGDSR